MPIYLPISDKQWGASTTLTSITPPLNLCICDHYGYLSPNDNNVHIWTLMFLMKFPVEITLWSRDTDRLCSKCSLRGAMCHPQAPHEEILWRRQESCWLCGFPLKCFCKEDFDRSLRNIFAVSLVNLIPSNLGVVAAVRTSNWSLTNIISVINIINRLNIYCVHIHSLQ